jgi:4-amino-4-deoxy-L-arabinose transferase-like glycosyltransferase
MRFFVTFLLPISLFLVIAASLIPLVDPSEARFALIAKLNPDFATPPKFYNNENALVPYISKPPVYIWLVTFFQKVLPLELASRLPSFLCFVITILVFFWIEKRYQVEGIVYKALRFPVFCLVPLLGLTDPLFSFSLFLWFFYVFFVRAYWLGAIFLALAALTKGPVAIALTLAPAAYALARKQISLIAIAGIYLIGALPLIGWLWVVETQYPGLGSYYLVEENILRFVGGADIEYGTLHREPYGLAALVSVLFFIPAIPQVLKILFTYVEETSRADFLRNLIKTQVLWVILFFSASSTFIPSYLLPLAYFGPLLVALEGLRFSVFWDYIFGLAAFVAVGLVVGLGLAATPLYVVAVGGLFLLGVFLVSAHRCLIFSFFFTVSGFYLVGLSRSNKEVAAFKNEACESLILAHKRHHSIELYSKIPVRRVSSVEEVKSSECVILEKNEFVVDEGKKIIADLGKFIVYRAKD